MKTKFLIIALIFYGLGFGQTPIPVVPPKYKNVTTNNANTRVVTMDGTGQVQETTAASIASPQTFDQTLTVGNTSSQSFTLNGGSNTGVFNGNFINYYNAAAPGNNFYLFPTNLEFATAANSYTYKYTGTGIQKLQGGNTSTLTFTTPTANRTITVKDGTGTLAFTSDIPSTPTWDQTITAANSTTQTFYGKIGASNTMIFQPSSAYISLNLPSASTTYTIFIPGQGQFINTGGVSPGQIDVTSLGIQRFLSGSTTYLRFATPSGSNTITFPAATGNAALTTDIPFTKTGNDIVNNNTGTVTIKGVGLYANTSTGSLAVGDVTNSGATGTNITSFGQYAGYSNSGNNNTNIGQTAGSSNTGSENTNIGLGAGTNSSGSYNTNLGNPAGSGVSLSRTINIGPYSSPSSTNQVSFSTSSSPGNNLRFNLPSSGNVNVSVRNAIDGTMAFVNDVPKEIVFKMTGQTNTAFVGLTTVFNNTGDTLTFDLTAGGGYFHINGWDPAHHYIKSVYAVNNYQVGITYHAGVGSVDDFETNEYGSAGPRAFANGGIIVIGKY